MLIPTAQRHYNENDYAHEGRNGRIYSGILGWRWYPFHGASVVEGSDPDGYKTRKEAIRDGLRLLNPKITSRG